MRWTKRGHVYVPDGTRWWARKYASFPTVDVLGDVLRVYFATLDERNFGRIGYVDLDAREPSRVVAEAPAPILDLGDVGTFDDCGVNPFSIVTKGKQKYLYYQGWQRTERVPYLIFTGLAIDDGEGGGFRRYSRKPILDRTENDLFLRGAPFVLEEGDLYRMWYASCRQWVPTEAGLRYEVVICHARSADAIHWDADPAPCVTPPRDSYGVGRPSVWFDGRRYRMWYSIRGFRRPYRIGYAESADGTHWTPLDYEASIETSSSGWDSAMVCYPHVVPVDGRLLMFYNGNQHGSTGFGYAEAA